MTEDNKDDSSLDILGAGKIVKAIPPEALNKVFGVLCETLEKLISPVTSATTGVAGYISAKFDGLIEYEKLNTAHMLKSAFEKTSGKIDVSTKEPNILVIIKIIESSSTQNDQNLQELWSNLLANELVHKSVHPEFVHILSRLSSKDAYRLMEFAKRDSKPPTKVTLSFKMFGREINFRGIVDEEKDFTNAHLFNLGLIEHPLVVTDYAKKRCKDTCNLLEAYSHW